MPKPCGASKETGVRRRSEIDWKGYPLNILGFIYNTTYSMWSWTLCQRHTHTGCGLEPGICIISTSTFSIQTHWRDFCNVNVERATQRYSEACKDTGKRGGGVLSKPNVNFYNCRWRKETCGAYSCMHEGLRFTCNSALEVLSRWFRVGDFRIQASDQIWWLLKSMSVKYHSSVPKSSSMT